MIKIYKQSKNTYHIYNVAVDMMINNNNKTFKWKSMEMKKGIMSRCKKDDNYMTSTHS